MSTNSEIALKELEAKFGDLKLLTDEQISGFIGESARRQAYLRMNGRHPLPPIYIGRTPKSSIYDLAKFLSGKAPMPEDGAAAQSKADADKEVRKARAGVPELPSKSSAPNPGASRKQAAAAHMKERKLNRPSLGPLLFDQ
jgi:hypothetical protein